MLLWMNTDSESGVFFGCLKRPGMFNYERPHSLNQGLPLTYEPETLINYIAGFSTKKIFVIGDVVVDEFIWGKASRISPEAPVPVVNVISRSFRLGGATNVAHNIHSLGGKVSICGVVGENETGQWVQSSLNGMGIENGGLITEKNRPTTLKTRVIAHNQQVLRYDQETKTAISPQSMKKIIGHIEKNLDEIDGIIVSDYGKGVISRQLLSELLQLTHQSKKAILVDPKIDNFPFYNNITLIAPNQKEASEMAEMEIITQEDLIQAGKKLLTFLKAKMVLITQGEEGMTLFEESGDTIHIPTTAKKVYDVTGAGDTVIASLALTLAAGASPIEAALISNHAAGVVVGEIGTGSVSPKELERAIRDHTFDPSE